MLIGQNIFWATLMTFAIGAVLSLLLYKNDQKANITSTTFSIIGSILGIYTSILTFVNGGFSSKFSTNLPLLTMSFKVDLLSAYFILIISIITLLSAIYGFGYIKHYYSKYNIGSLGFFFNIFIAGMILVVSSSNAIMFLLAWELMSLSSYFLVIFEKKKEETIKAGSLYFYMTHAGTAFIILAFLLLYRSTGSFDFETIKSHIGLISPLAKSLIFIFSLIGFGTKAGIIPFHIWLPSAHPAAPSHVSALMSGVMIKTGIFMMIRIFVDIFSGGSQWWGITILIIGAISALLGVLYALVENDIKKLLAYSSIENIGIILLGLGSSLTLNSLGLHALANLSLIATLFHILNHAVFKSLLFMGAGSVFAQTGTRNLEEYGGLIKLMPYTAIFFLIGSLAISALPPLNGFASEWLTFQALFAGIRSSNGFNGLIFILSTGALALTGGLAAACFVKLFGITFLARPRTQKAVKATDPSFPLTLSMGILAALTLVIGLSSGIISQALNKISNSLGMFKGLSRASNYSWASIKTSDTFASTSLLNLFLVSALVCLIIYIVSRIYTKGNKIREEITWDCGTDLQPRMEITATGFSRSIITIFDNILKPSKEIETVYSEANPKYYPKESTVNLETKEVYTTHLYDPIVRLITKISELAKSWQGGNINTYILYIFVVLIVLLTSGVLK